MAEEAALLQAQVEAEVFQLAQEKEAARRAALAARRAKAQVDEQKFKSSYLFYKRIQHAVLCSLTAIPCPRGQARQS